MHAIRAGSRLDSRRYSIDGSQDGVKRTCDGQFVGTAARSPHKMGTIAAETAHRVPKGETVAKVIHVDSL